MRANLASRLRRLETRQTAISEKARPIIQFADVERLPRSYVGERHLVQIDRPGSERPAYEERPGPGPDIEIDPNTILVFFVPSPRESQAAA
jgi:hypothetical protein